MAMYKNYVEIIGNLGDNPKYLQSSNNQPRFTFDVCTSRPYKQGNEWKSVSTWVKCAAWGNLATTLARMNFEKGNLVQIEGELRTSKWTSNSGEQHTDIYIQVNEMRKMARPAKQENDSNRANASQFASQPSQATQDPEYYDDDDLPY